MNQNAFNVYVGSETGLLKGVNLDKKSWCNINSVTQASRELEIKVMCWADETEKQVCIALKNQTVCIFNTEEAEVTKNHDFKTGEDEVIVGLAKLNESFVTCTRSGVVRLWDKDDVSQEEIQVGPDIEKMLQNPRERNIIATGGMENDLKIWDLQKPTEPIFKAKNVRNDWLNLRVPVNVKSMDFIPETQKIVTCTGHHQVRVYDPSSAMRRPVVDMTWGEYPINALSLRPNHHQVIVGNTHGEMALLDIRKKGTEVVKYKGFAGAIRDVKCHSSLDIVAACGLDRFLRLYDINSKKLLDKYYLKSRLNCIVFSSRLLGENNLQSDGESDKEMKSTGENVDADDIWDNIPVVQTKPVSKKRKNSNTEGLEYVNNNKPNIEVGEIKKLKSSVNGKKRKKPKKVQ